MARALAGTVAGTLARIFAGTLARILAGTLARIFAGTLALAGGIGCGGSTTQSAVVDGPPPSVDRLGDAAADAPVPGADIGGGGDETGAPPPLAGVPGLVDGGDDAGTGVGEAGAMPDGTGAAEDSGLGPEAGPLDLDAGPDVLLMPPACSPRCPTAIAPQSLQLWLRGDVGVECGAPGLPGRVAVWRDLSGHAHDARPAPGMKGPVCGPAAGALAGRAVVMFPALADELTEDHLEVELGQLVGSGFTIAVVEQRTPGRFNSFMLGSQLPYPDALSCGINLNQGAGLLFGYDRPARVMVSDWGTDCDLRVPVSDVTTNPALTVASFAPGHGFSLFVGGKRYDDPEASGLDALDTVLVGRGWGGKVDVAGAPERADSRYQGRIAEVVIFSAALSDPDRAALIGYLHETWNTDP